MLRWGGTVPVVAPDVGVATVKTIEEYEAETAELRRECGRLAHKAFEPLGWVWELAKRTNAPCATGCIGEP